MRKQASVELSEVVDTGEIEAGVELELMVRGLHMLTKLIKGSVMFFLFEVGEFMDDDHP